jgi:DNA-binding NtrC family response regulator
MDTKYTRKAMKEFIAVSEEAQKALHMAKIAAPMPVNVLIVGPKGVGKKLLAAHVCKECKAYSAQLFYRLYKDQMIDPGELNEVILYDLEKLTNATQFLEAILAYDIKVIATANAFNPDYMEKFLVKIELSPLSHRPSDSEKLKELFLQDAKETLFVSETIDEDNITCDLSKNAISLKESIYKSLLFNNLHKEQLIEVMQNYFEKNLQEENDYKQLLEIFDVALLKAAKNRFGSQLQMSKRLHINRVTLRKKIAKYGLEL